MQLDHVRTFIDLMESRNFNCSAEQLGVTQSTVSWRIRSLEGRIGSELFQRGRAGVEPTASGRGFVPYARLARDDVRAFNCFEGSIRVGAPVGMTGALLPLWAKALGRMLPHSSVHVESDYLPQKVLAFYPSTLDFAAVYAPRFFQKLFPSPGWWKFT
jgi:DNA-binding transcriptional LysR family regulator